MPKPRARTRFSSPLGKPRDDTRAGTEIRKCLGCARKIVAHFVVCFTCRERLTEETRRNLWRKGKAGERAVSRAIRELSKEII